MTNPSDISVNSVKLISRVDKAGRGVQEILTTWTNNGSSPVRMVEAKFHWFIDEEFQSWEIASLYWGAAINPGETHSTHRGAGFILPKLELGNRAEVEITDIA